MMKNLLLLGVALLITSCCCTNTQYVQYRPIAVTPVVAVAPVVAVRPIVTPVVLDVDYPAPLDVTTTTIDYY